MNESIFWKMIQRAMKGRWDATRHEDSAKSGIPDVSYGIEGKNGWIELKYLPTFPAKETTPIKVRHFTPEQRIFLMKRGAFGGNCWFFIKIEHEYFIFDHTQVKMIDIWNRREMMANARFYWFGRPVWDEFVELLSRGC